MADDEGTGNDEVELDDEDEEGGEQGKKKLLFIIIGVVVLLLAAGGAAFFMMGGEEEPTKEEVALAEDGTLADSAEGLAEAAKGPQVPVFYDVPEFLVDLNTSDRRKSSFLKMKVSIELASQADVKTLEAYMPRVRDNFITYLRELRASDLSGSAGLYRLREELMLRINQAIAPAKVNNILFKEIIVQ
ncbi:MAG: flagellar basal body-associated FliL family protein [Rickettsiales bacterium]|nr:flagellar basal body-associated FliL family protein [Rickettsiales bacterium]